MPNLDIQIRGGESLAIRLQATSGNLQEGTKNILKLAQELAFKEMHDHFPQSENNKSQWGGYKDNSERRAVEGLEKTEGKNDFYTYRPGRSGGGGFYEARVGFDPEKAPEHARFVFEGTSDIPVSEGNVGPLMRVRSRGGAFQWRRHRKGHDADLDWVIRGQEKAELVVALGMRKLDQDLFNAGQRALAQMKNK